MTSVAPVRDHVTPCDHVTSAARFVQSGEGLLSHALNPPTPTEQEPLVLPLRLRRRSGAFHRERVFLSQAGFVERGWGWGGGGLTGNWWAEIAKNRINSEHFERGWIFRRRPLASSRAAEACPLSPEVSVFLVGFFVLRGGGRRLINGACLARLSSKASAYVRRQKAAFSAGPNRSEKQRSGARRIKTPDEERCCTCGAFVRRCT